MGSEGIRRWPVYPTSWNRLRFVKQRLCSRPRSLSNLKKFSDYGSYISSKIVSGGTKEDHLSILEDIELDKSNNIYLTDRGPHEIHKYIIAG